MVEEDYKEFLNKGILGGGAGVFEERTFKAIDKRNIDPPKYNVKFLETFPTAWAAAYAFQRSLEEQDAIAIEEWACLFLLHYVGELHLKSHEKDKLIANYDKDLWPAFSGTYPRRDDLSDIRLLKTGDEVVVGAYYTEVVFFPSRGRSKWAEDKNLKSYLKGTNLSWAQCRDSLLKDPNLRREFYSHLRSIAEHILKGELKNALIRFCETRRIFKNELDDKSLKTARDIDRDPDNWNLFRTEEFNEENLLYIYPLKQKRNGKGYTYYLVSGLPTPDGWMTTPITPGMPRPDEYHKGEGKTIVVKARGQEKVCSLNSEDDVVPLKGLFLSDPTYLCGVPKGSKSHKGRSLHEMEVRDNRGIFSALKKESDVAVCLAPVKSGFLKHFPEILRNPDKVAVSRARNDEDLEWSFTVLGKPVTWFNKPIHSKALPNASLAIWPPKIAEDWHLYVAYGTGKKHETGRWILVDERGSIEATKNVELDDEEYVSILHDPVASCKPMAVLLLDDDDTTERGVLFLSEFPPEAKERKSASLSVDFGTSNTCIAYKVEGEESKPLTFDLSPVMLWGSPPPKDYENAGSVPFNWAAGKFFPTILLARRRSDLTNIRSDEVELEHLFHVDIPGLHKGMEARLFTGELSGLWETYKDMKWELDSKKPWRSLFLGLSLLYAHAELFFRKSGGALVNKYVFTFPLALTSEADTYLKAAKDVTKKIRKACYGGRLEAVEDINKLDESTAIATFAMTDMAGSAMEIFVDVGGGTADIAIRHNNQFLVLDSVKVAGKTFFRFADKNFSESKIHGAKDFKRHLGSLLLDIDEELPFHQIKIDLGTFYSVAINALDDSKFKEKEQAILKEGMGRPSFQLYRTQLFFRHIIAYSLLQACAAAVDKKLPLTKGKGIKMTFGGNAWGLLLFAEFSRFKDTLRKESQEILQALKKHLLNLVEEDEKKYIEHLEEIDVELLSKKTLSDAKTAVAIGALKALETRKATGREQEISKPYAGITLKNVRVEDFDPITIRWNERWEFDHLKDKVKKELGVPLGDDIRNLSFDRPEDFERPFDPVLSVFTCLGNSSRRDQDPMPPEEWAKINGLLCQSHAYLENFKPGRSPINYFLSGILYPEEDEHFLNELATINKSFIKD